VPNILRGHWDPRRWAIQEEEEALEIVNETPASGRGMAGARLGKISGWRLEESALEKIGTPAGPARG